MKAQVLGVLFNPDTTPADAAQFLKDSSSFLQETPLRLDTATQCLKSNQVEYDGPTRLVENPDFPGVQFIVPGFTKGRMSKATVVAEDVDDEADDTLYAPDDAEPDQDAGDQAPVVVDDKGPVKMGKPGSRWCKAFLRSLEDLQTQSTAALEDVEQPDMRAEAEKAHGILRDIGAVLKATSGKVYGEEVDENADPAAIATAVAEAAGAGTESDEARKAEADKKPVSPETLKSMFYGDRVFVPSGIVKSVQRVARAKGKLAVEEAVGFLQRSLVKGFMPAADVEVSAPNDEAAEMRLATFRLEAAMKRSAQQAELTKKS